MSIKFDGSGLMALTNLGSAMLGGLSDYSNLQFQKDVFEWQKEQWQNIMKREDTAVFRYARDARRAGLSPLFKTPQAQTSSAPKLNAPQFKMQNLLMAKQMQSLAADILVKKSTARKQNAEAGIVEKTAGAEVSLKLLEAEFAKKTLVRRIYRVTLENQKLVDEGDRAYWISQYNRALADQTDLVNTVREGLMVQGIKHPEEIKIRTAMVLQEMSEWDQQQWEKLGVAPGVAKTIMQGIGALLPW